MQSPQGKWQTFSRRCGKWRNLQPQERAVLYRLVILQGIAGLYLRLGGFAYARERMQRRVTSGIGSAQGLHGLSLVRLAELARMAGRVGIFRTACLERSLALHTFLGRCGIASEIRIGVVPGSDPLQAHAWLEAMGESIGRDSLEDFHVFESLQRQDR